MSQQEDEKRQRIGEIRQAHARINNILTLGTAFSEKVTVKGVDMQEHEVTVYALSDEDLGDAFESTGADVKDIGDRDKLIANMKLLRKVAALATRNPEISKQILPMESSRIAMKAFEISGLTKEPGSPNGD